MFKLILVRALVCELGYAKCIPRYSIFPVHVQCDLLELDVPLIGANCIVLGTFNIAGSSSNSKMRVAAVAV